jgi:two-component system, NtrC family, sensor kinase
VRLPLAARVSVALCVGAALIVVAADAVNLRLQRRHLERLVALSAERIAETIRSATRDAMIRNDAPDVHRIIQNVGSQQGITRVRIFSKEGRIRTSTLASEVDALVDVKAEQCTACHRSDRPLVKLDRKDRVRIFVGPDGQRTLGVIAPLYNEPQCTTACHAHPASQRVLGVLDVQLSMASVDEALSASERQLSWGLLATVAAVLVLVGLLVWRLVLSPVHRLHAAMAGVAGGDLDVRVPVSSHDEMGDLAASWNSMTDELRRARRELLESNLTLERRVEEKTRQVERAHHEMALVEKMASLGKLAAVVAHEINNPLAGIRTYARLLRRRAGLPGHAHDGESERILEMVDSEAGRCGDIVRNLLLFSRGSAARFGRCAVPPLLERCRMLLRHQAELLGVTLELDVAEGVPEITCDAGQVEQMALALAMNALEATPEGGRVVLGVRPEGAGLAVTVSDTGAGIAEEDQARVYEPFFTTKETGNGVGLGLAVVYGIVSRHGGRIDLVSRPGAGTVFTVHLRPEPPASVEQGGKP